MNSVWDTLKNVGYSHGCQNHDLDHRFARFYDPISPKRLGSHWDRKNGIIVRRMM